MLYCVMLFCSIHLQIINPDPKFQACLELKLLCHIIKVLFNGRIKMIIILADE